MKQMLHPLKDDGVSVGEHKADPSAEVRFEGAGCTLADSRGLPYRCSGRNVRAHERFLLRIPAAVGVTPSKGSQIISGTRLAVACRSRHGPGRKVSQEHSLPERCRLYTG